MPGIPILTAIHCSSYSAAADPLSHWLWTAIALGGVLTSAGRSSHVGCFRFGTFFVLVAIYA